VSHATLRRLAGCGLHGPARQIDAGRGCRAGRAAHSGAGSDGPKIATIGVPTAFRQVHRARIAGDEEIELGDDGRRGQEIGVTGEVHDTVRRQRGPDENPPARDRRACRSARSRRIARARVVPRAREPCLRPLLDSRVRRSRACRSWGGSGLAQARDAFARMSSGIRKPPLPPCRPAPGRSPRGPAVAHCRPFCFCAEILSRFGKPPKGFQP